MANKKRPARVRQEYNKRFQTKYGMTRSEFRELKDENPQKAHEIKIKLATK